MRIISNFRFLYIFDQSGLLCGMPSQGLNIEYQMDHLDPKWFHDLLGTPYASVSKIPSVKMMISFMNSPISYHIASVSRSPALFIEQFGGQYSSQDAGRSIDPQFSYDKEGNLHQQPFYYVLSSGSLTWVSLKNVTGS